MFRRLIVALAAVLTITTLPARAEEPASGRYQIQMVAGGFVRLDTVTGAMTFCRDGADSPICGPMEAAPGSATKETASKDDRQKAQSFDEALSMAEKAMRSFMAIAREDKRDCTL